MVRMTMNLMPKQPVRGGIIAPIKNFVSSSWLGRTAYMVAVALPTIALTGVLGLFALLGGCKKSSEFKAGERLNSQQLKVKPGSDWKSVATGLLTDECHITPTSKMIAAFAVKLKAKNNNAPEPKGIVTAPLTLCDEAFKTYGKGEGTTTPAKRAKVNLTGITATFDSTAKTISISVPFTNVNFTKTKISNLKVLAGWKADDGWAPFVGLKVVQGSESTSGNILTFKLAHEAKIPAGKHTLLIQVKFDVGKEQKDEHADVKVVIEGEKPPAYAGKSRRGSRRRGSWKRSKSDGISVPKPPDSLSKTIKKSQ